jgi:sarcosine oxidase
VTRTNDYDVAVIGLGAFGAAAASALAQEGIRVLGLDRFDPPHNHGSSGGETRILRLAYAEDSGYVPLLRESYRGWRSLQERSGKDLFEQCGGLMIGSPAGELIEGVDLTAASCGLRVERLGASQIRERYPLFQPNDSYVGRLDPEAGFLHVPSAIRAQLDLARTAGARLLTNTAVDSWRVLADQRIEIRTVSATYNCAKIVVTAGAWIGELIEALAPHIEVRRQPVFWFEPGPDMQDCAGLPVFIWEHQPRRIVYGFPAGPDGLKIAIHHEGDPTAPDAVDREVHSQDRQRLREITDQHMPGGYGVERRAEICLYSNTPDGHFVIDRHPQHPQVCFASACSGHGFKFAPAVGGLLADLVRERTPSVRIDHLSLSRFTRTWTGSTSRIRGGSADFVGATASVGSAAAPTTSKI